MPITEAKESSNTVQNLFDNLCLYKIYIVSSRTLKFDGSFFVAFDDERIRLYDLLGIKQSKSSSESDQKLQS